ncbi:MAG: REP-associated tyrosine transposase [Longimicrobiales bacterium]
MPRRKRSYHPGCVFHLTSRSSGREHWFDEELRDDIVRVIRDALHRTDARLIAFVIMSNHMHLIVKQGNAPLARLMQPVGRRTALLVQKKHGRSGHILERGFHDRECASSDHLRQAIYYIHRNPVKAGLCAVASEYHWSSHHVYCGAPASLREGSPAITPALELFAASANATTHDLYAGYDQFADWRRRCDALPPDVAHPRGPVFPWGDLCWSRDFHRTPIRDDSSRRDLCDIARQTIREIAPGLTLDLLCVRGGGRLTTITRREIVARAKAAGHCGAAIARYLNLSETTVSRVATTVFIRQCGKALGGCSPGSGGRY